jgi:hypothetical protein
LRSAPLVLAAVCFLAAGPAPADEFFSVRDENPLVRGYYLPLPSDARQASGGSFSATLAISNTTNVDQDATEHDLIDGESAALRLTYENALSSSWHYRLTVPLIRDSGGFLDTVIEDWHRWFGFNQGYRPYYPKNQLDYTYSGLSHLVLNRDATSLGDISADLGWFARDDARHTLSFWGGVKAPTGSLADLTSDGAWDGALWAHYAVRLSRWQVGAEVGLAQPFGDELFAGHAHQTSAFGRAALTRSLGDSWSLRAQLDGQTRRVADSGLRLTGPSLQLSVGATRRLWRQWRIEMGFAEDAAVNTAPDITFFLGIRN